MAYEVLGATSPSEVHNYGFSLERGDQATAYAKGKALRSAYV